MAGPTKHSPLEQLEAIRRRGPRTSRLTRLLLIAVGFSLTICTAFLIPTVHWRTLITIYYSMGSLAVAFAFYLGQIDGLVLDEKVRNIAERVSSLSSGTVPQSDVFRQSLFRPLDFDRQFLIGIRPYRGLIGAGGIFVDLAATLIWVWVPGA
jgi:hypothetical protein